jgi:hypothetical protein
MQGDVCHTALERSRREPGGWAPWLRSTEGGTPILTTLTGGTASRGSIIVR